MPGATFDREARVLRVSQSFLQDFMRCPERARQRLLHPSHQWNDALAVGTATHLFMEARLHGRSFHQSSHRARSWLEEASSRDDFRFVKVAQPVTMFRHLDGCIEGMERHVVPQVPAGGHVEQTMRYELARTEDGWVVVLEGTPDYLDPFDRLWDWKTASSEYNAHETANWAIQPTSYTYLASQLRGYPVTEFTYAVAVKPHGYVQFIDTVREQGEWAWLARVSLGLLSMCRRMLSQDWPVVHTHYLCDPKWCPAWDGCRGAYLHPDLVQSKGQSGQLVEVGQT